MAAASASSLDRLRLVAGLAKEAGVSELAVEATDLAARVTQGRFFVACVGQFKRGKSTLLNALLGRAILPTGVTPITTAVTVIRYGETLSAVVRFSDGRRLQVDPDRLADYVSEAGNPENHKGVLAVEVTVPSTLLASGMCLVDTPGLGSVFAANTAATRAFVPQVDAALVVLGTDPPISGDELALVEEIGKQIDRLVFVLNKSDRVAEAESQEAATFTGRVIARRLERDVDDIYRISATERLSGHTTRDWARLEDVLKDLAGRSAAVVDAAAARGLVRVASAFLQDLNEQRDALTRPIEESERRLVALRHATTEAGYALRELSARLRVEQVALSSQFGDVREAFLADEIPAAQREMADDLRVAPVRRGPTFRLQALDLSHEVARRRVITWADRVEPKAEAMYSETMARFVELANSFVARLASGVSDTIALREEEFAVERRFREDTHFFFTSLMALATPGFWAWVLDWVRPHQLLVASAIRQASRFVARLMVTNSARVANDLTARVEESQRRFESEIRARLSVLLTTAERALERARVQQAAGAESVGLELLKIDDMRKHVNLLNHAGGQPGESS